MIITFLYYVKEVRYYGKYVGYVSDNYEEGLDVEVRNTVFPELAAHYGIKDSSEIPFGILSFLRNGHDYFSEQEKDAFDLLYLNWSNQPKEVFLHGRPFIK